MRTGADTPTLRGSQLEHAGAVLLVWTTALAVAVGHWVNLQWHFSTVSVAPVFWSALGAAAGLAARAVPGRS